VNYDKKRRIAKGVAWKLRAQAQNLRVESNPMWRASFFDEFDAQWGAATDGEPGT
jgi:hypothetical protein